MWKTRWLGLVGGLLLTSSGCCWWADKMCPQSHYAQPACYQTPQCCQPCQPVCQPWTPQASSGYPTQPITPVPASPPPCAK